MRRMPCKYCRSEKVRARAKREFLKSTLNRNFGIPNEDTDEYYDMILARAFSSFTHGPQSLLSA